MCAVVPLTLLRLRDTPELEESSFYVYLTTSYLTSAEILENTLVTTSAHSYRT